MVSETYYLVTAPLGSSEAARELKLAVSIKDGDVTANATFTFSIPKYAEKLLSDADATNVEKSLIKDVLEYVQASYVYFAEMNTAEEIERVVALTGELLSVGGDYEGEIKFEGNVNDNTNIISAVTLNLDAKPTIRFYLADENNADIEFYADGKRLDANPVEKDSYGAYIELDVYAYALAETITYKLVDENGEYHVTDYLLKVEEDTDAENYDNLVNLAHCFVNYLEGAAAYRNSVIVK